MNRELLKIFFFFFNDTATTEIYTLSLHDALPIFPRARRGRVRCLLSTRSGEVPARSEEHTSELQSHHDLVCRLLLEKKKNRQRRDVRQNEARNSRPAPQRPTRD